MKKRSWIDSELFRAEQAARIYDQAPELVHAFLSEQSRDRTAPASLKEISDNPDPLFQRDRELEHELFQRIESVLAGLPQQTRELVSHLRVNEIEDFVDSATGTQSSLLDRVVTELLTREGPAAFGTPAILHHLTSVWAAMTEGQTAAERRSAKHRWTKIMLSSPPNLSTIKNRTADPLEVAAAVDQVQSALEAVRRERLHSTPAVTRALRAALPTWTTAAVDQFARALRQPDRHEARRLRDTPIAKRFGLSPGALPEIVAEGRRARKRRQQLEDLGRRTFRGWRRYKAWQKAKATS